MSYMSGAEYLLSISNACNDYLMYFRVSGVEAVRKHAVSVIAILIVATACAMALLTLLMCIKLSSFFGIIAQ